MSAMATALALTALAAFPLESLGQSFAEIDVSTLSSHQTFAPYEIDAHRRLYGRQWSFANLLFHIGLCSADNCHNHAGPCGCPDCSRPHPVGWQHGYCNSYDSSGSSGVSADGSSYYVDSDGNKYYDDGSTGNQQGSRRSYYFWLAAAVGGSAALAGTAFAMRKRALIAAKTKGSSDNSEAPTATTSYSMMGTVGVGAAAAIGGVMARLGLKQGGSDSGSVTSGSSGIVSRRMALLENEGPTTPVDDPSVAPSFIDIQNETEPHWDETTVLAEEGIEVEGPFRPSQYGV